MADFGPPALVDRRLDSAVAGDHDAVHEIGDSVGGGTAPAVEPGHQHVVGKPVSPSAAQDTGVSQRRRAIAMPQPGSVPRKGTEKPAGTTGAPPYGSSTPKPNSSSEANKPPYGG